MREDFCGDIHAGIAFSPADEMAALATMLTIRRFEEKAGQLFALGTIAGPCQLSIGQEAVSVGLTMAGGSGDVVTSGPRCHGLMIARGTSLSAIMAELMGKPGGLCQGQGRGALMSDTARGFFGANSAAGTAISKAAGLVFAKRYLDSGQPSGATNGFNHGAGPAAAIAVIGDGAESDGAVYEALVLAVQLALPLVIAIDNNATGLPSERPIAIAALAAALGVGFESVDGIDVRKVRAAGKRALDRARNGAGPQILEMQTYRYRGHGLPTGSAKSAPRREDSDPIAKARARILEEGIASEESLKALERSTRDEVMAAANRARQGVCHPSSADAGLAPNAAVAC